jgi:DNA-binding MarR family transcriptional regulator
MKRGAGEWPAERWGLTAPESYVLYSAPTVSGSEAFKLALRELALRRAIRMERHGMRRGTGTASEPALEPVLEVFNRAARGVDVVRVNDLAREAKRAFGRSFAGYVNDHVYPSLEQRGLIRAEESRFLGILRRRRHRLTPEGREALDELREWLWVGEDRLGRWVRDDPDRALAYAGGAGASLLLMSGLYPELERLGRRFLEGGDAPLGGGVLDIGLFSEEAGGGGLDSIDAGFDAGGAFGGFGDGGGGGGGDGGGGGG